MLSFARAVAWFGVVVVFWSLNVRWGTDPDVGAGPPGQWERQVVGAGLLAFIAATALSASGRKGNPPSWRARAIAFAAAVIILVIAVMLRHNAVSGVTGADIVAGPGWTWLLSGGGFVLGAATMTLALKPAGSAATQQANKPEKGGKKTPARSGHGKKKRRGK